MSNWENRYDAIILTVFEVWTKNGLGLSYDENEEALKACRDAATNAWVEGLTDQQWIDATLMRLNSSRTELAVLDDNTVDAMVLGYAADERAAMRVANEADRGRATAATVQPAELRYDPDLHTREEVDRVAADGRAWIVTWAAEP